MYQDLKQLYGKKLGATDGDIGHVKDFYFDDQTWMVRYLVADTGSWLPGRQVLLSPHAFVSHAFGKQEADARLLRVNLTRKQIEGSPSIDTHRTVSRQNEEDYYKYYGWPTYWDGGGLWGVAGLAGVTLPSTPESRLRHGHNQRDDIHLRSTQSVTGYQIRATDGGIGSVTSFTIDPKSWAIRELVVETGHWYSGKKILILPKDVVRISYDESTVHVSLTQNDLKLTVRDDVAQAAGTT